MKIVAWLFAACLLGLGIVFLAGNQGVVLRIVVGAVLVAAAVALVAVVHRAPTVLQRNVVQRIDLSGDVRLQDLTCRECGGKLDADAVRVEAGAVFVSCPYCKASYQLEEAPKW